MNALWSIAGLGAGMYALRLVGFLAPDVALPRAWERALAFLPVALLAALVVSGLGGASGGDPARIGAAVGATLVAWRTRRMWACIAAGMAIVWLLRLL